MNFLKHQSGSCVAVNGGMEISQISSKRSSFVHLYSKDERKSCRFGVTWRNVITDWIFILGRTIPLMHLSVRWLWPGVLRWWRSTGTVCHHHSSWAESDSQGRTHSSSPETDKNINTGLMLCLLKYKQTLHTSPLCLEKYLMLDRLKSSEGWRHTLPFSWERYISEMSKM